MNFIAQKISLSSYQLTNKFTVVGYYLFVWMLLLSGAVYSANLKDNSHLHNQENLNNNEKLNIIKSFKEALLERGVWLNAPIPGQDNADAILAEEDIQKILIEFTEKNSKLAKTPIRVFIYESSIPNAWVSRFNENSRNFSSINIKEVNKALGYNPDTGFIELGITTALLKVIPKKRDALAFIIGHESGHIVEDHLKDGSKITAEEFRKGWVDKHIHEFAADVAGIDLMAGLFNIDEASSTLRSLFNLNQEIKREKIESYEIEKIVNSAMNSATATHPHEGVRLAFAEASARYKKRKLAIQPPSVQLQDFYIRLAQREKPREKIYLDDRTLKNFEKAFEGDPKEVTENYDWHTYSVNFPLRPEILDQVIEKLESVSSSDFLKTLTFFQTVTRSVDINRNGEKNIFKLSDVSAKQLEKWLNGLSKVQFDQVMEVLIKSEYGHVVLLSVSNIPKEMITPQNWTAIEKLVLSFFKKTIDRFILTDSDSYLNHQLDEDFRKTSNSRLRSAIIQMGLGYIKTIRSDNIDERVLKVANKSFSVHTDDMNSPKKVLAYDSIIKFINMSAIMPEAPYLKLSIASAVRAIQDSIENSIFRNFTFPEISKIKIKLQKNPAYESASKMGYDVDYLIPDNSHPPFEQFRLLEMLDFKHFGRYSNQVQTFLGDVVFGALQSIEDFHTITHLLSLSYNDKYDSLIAEEIIQRSGKLDDHSIILVLEAWQAIRKKIDHIPLRILPRQKVEMAGILKNIPNQKINRLALSSLSIYHDVGRLSLFLDSLNLHDILSRFKVVGTLLGSNRVIELVIESLVNRKISDGNEALLWIEILEKILTMPNSQYNMSISIQKRIQEVSESVLGHVSQDVKLSKIKIAKLRSILNQTSVVDVITQEAKKRIQSEASDIGKLPEILKKLESDLNIDSTGTIASAYRNSLGQLLKIQPQNRNLIDPTEDKSFTEMGRGHFAELVRGFSALLEVVRKFPTFEQVNFISFIIGKSTTIPRFIKQIDENQIIKKSISYTGRSFESWIIELKHRMIESNQISRTLIIHSFLTGPTGLMNTNDGQKQIEKLLLKDIPLESQKTINLIVDALNASEGSEYGLLLSYALAQKQSTSGEVNQGANGATLLKAFLESYGVPGIKFGQFMAFSSRFKEFRSAFESFQDSALPLSYIGMLRLLEKSMGVPWDPARFKVEDIKGSGSVNVAITVDDLKLGKNIILNVLREDIEIEARNDFKRFQKFIMELNRKSASSDIAFIGGVARLVEDSVKSEFDKPRAKKMHDYAEAQYAHRVGNWTVRSIRAHEVVGRSLVTSMASGVSAREVLNTKPEVYNQAMKAFLSVAKQRIQGIGPDGNPTDKPIISDPDLHNGQIFIDEKTKTITLLDKGQGSTPTTTERELAKTLFRIATRLSKGNEIYKQLRVFEKIIGITLNSFHIERIVQLQKLETPIDRYLNIIGYLREVGKVPIASVDWGFEFYRLTELASQIDRNYELQIKSVLLDGVLGATTRKVLDIYGNTLKKNSVPVLLGSPAQCMQFYREISI